MTPNESSLKYLTTRLALMALLFSSVPVARADDQLNLSTPEEAIRTRFEVLDNGDYAGYAATTQFPEVQLFHDDRHPTINADSEELEKFASNMPKFTLIDVDTLEETNNFALTRVTFSVDTPGGKRTAAAWWGLKRTDEQWRIAWRQFLGPIENL